MNKQRYLFLFLFILNMILNLFPVLTELKAFPKKCKRILFLGSPVLDIRHKKMVGRVHAISQSYSGELNEIQYDRVWLHAFSRHWCRLHVFASSSVWLIVLFTSFSLLFLNHSCLVARVFPRLAQITCICLEFWFADCVAYVFIHWQEK